MLYFAVHHLDADGGIQVTGSHNPPDHNGFKMMLGQGRSLRRRHPRARRARRAAATTRRAQGAVRAGRRVRRLCRAAGPGLRRRAAALPWSGMPATVRPAPAMAALAARLPGRHVLPVRRDRRPLPQPPPRPDRAGEPGRPDRARCAREGYEIGIGFDGDGDRIGVVDGKGRIVWGDQILQILAADVLGRPAGRGDHLGRQGEPDACSTRSRGWAASR